MKFIPQALADKNSRSILFVFRNEDDYRRNWAGHVKTVDAPGVLTHPRLIKVGDVVDTYITGWNRGTVSAIKFTPTDGDIPDYHRIGVYQLTVTGCGFINVRVDGGSSIDKIYTFPAS